MRRGQEFEQPEFSSSSEFTLKVAYLLITERRDGKGADKFWSKPRLALGDRAGT